MWTLLTPQHEAQDFYMPFKGCCRAVLSTRGRLIKKEMLYCVLIVFQLQEFFVIRQRAIFKDISAVLHKVYTLIRLFDAFYISCPVLVLQTGLFLWMKVSWFHQRNAAEAQRDQI